MGSPIWTAHFDDFVWLYTGIYRHKIYGGKMNRNVAIVVTIVTSLACGIPAFVLMCLGVLALFGTQVPEVMAENPGSTPEEVMLGAGVFLCVGVVFLIIPILVGVFSLRSSKKEIPDDFDYIPPAS
jgi:hypothetical protein